MYIHTYTYIYIHIYMYIRIYKHIWQVYVCAGNMTYFLHWKAINFVYCVFVSLSLSVYKCACTCECIASAQFFLMKNTWEKKDQKKNSFRLLTKTVSAACSWLNLRKTTQKKTCSLWRRIRTVVLRKNFQNSKNFGLFVLRRRRVGMLVHNSWIFIWGGCD